MKQFEKWWESYPIGGTREDKNYALEGCRAALKWVLTHKKHIKYKDYEFDWVKTDVIEQELRDE